MTQSLAQYAIDLFEDIAPGVASASELDIFLCQNGLKARVRRLGKDPKDCDLVFFKDGSALFAGEVEHHGYLPYAAADLYSTSDAEIVKSSATIFPDQTFEKCASMGYFNPAEFPAFTAHFVEALRLHEDPPEGARYLLVAPSQPFVWTDPGTAQQAISLLSMAAVILDPGVISISISADRRPGMLPRQVLLETKCASLLKQGSRAGVAFADIASSESHYSIRNPATEALRTLSKPLLERIGKPIGWNVQHLTGAKQLSSSHRAFAAEKDIAVQALISNHQRLDLHRSLMSGLSRIGLEGEGRVIVSRHRPWLQDDEEGAS